MYLIHDRDHGLADTPDPPPRGVGGGRTPHGSGAMLAAGKPCALENDMVLHTAGNTIRLAKLGHRLEPRATALCDWRTLQPNPKAQSWRAVQTWCRAADES